MTDRFTDGPCTATEADEDDSDRYPTTPATPTTPTTSRALANELKHFKRMAQIESDPPTRSLWQRLADEVETYLAPPEPAPALFGGDPV